MAYSKQSKKQKLEDICRVFNKVWIDTYFFTDDGDKAVCLICSKTVSVCKEYNAKCQFETKHNACIIHQENQCKSSLQLKHVMDPVVHAVNLLRARGLKHRQFRSMSDDMEADFTDVLYMSDS